MALSSRQTWQILDRYYDLRESWPVRSVLDLNVGASHDQSVTRIPGQLVFVVETGTAMAKLTEAQREALDAVHHTSKIMDTANCEARNEASAARWTTLPDVREQHLAARREAVRAGLEAQAELHRLRRRRAYTTAMATLSAELEVPVLVAQLARVLNRI